MFSDTKAAPIVGFPKPMATPASDGRDRNEHPAGHGCARASHRRVPPTKGGAYNELPTGLLFTRVGVV